MTIGIPTLSLEGVIYDPVKKADYLLSCFYTSQYSQSNAWLGRIQSLPYLIKESTGNGALNPELLSSNTEVSLKAIMIPWFDSVTVSVTYEDEVRNDSIFNIIVNIAVVDDGVPISIKKALEIYNSRLIRVADMLENREVKLF